MQRVMEGICRPIPPSEWFAWSHLTGNVVNQVEYDILVAMDREFCDETNKELRALDARRQEEHQKQLDEQSKVRGK